MPRSAWKLPRLRLPQWSFLTQWRDKLGDIRPTADSLPEVYEEKRSAKSGAGKAEPAVSAVPVDADSDDPFAVAEDLSGAPLVSTAANPEKNRKPRLRRARPPLLKFASPFRRTRRQA